jgi:hypothetical protein
MERSLALPRFGRCRPYSDRAVENMETWCPQRRYTFPMDLLLCPICGHTAPELVAVPDQETVDFAVHCAECNGLGPSDANAEYASEMWNKRMPVFS